MPSVLCRFQVVGMELVYDQKYEERDGKYVPTWRGVSRKVKLQPVSAPFGDATPSGYIEMVIRDPGAGEVFERAFREGVRDPDRAKMDVMFTWNPDGESE